MLPTKLQKRIVRHRRVRAKIKGIAQRPRVSVFRSNRHIFAQVIDDQTRKTMLSSKLTTSSKSKAKHNKTQQATAIGENLAEQLTIAGIKQIVFDRGGYRYHGRVKALADGLRKGGIKF